MTGAAHHEWQNSLEEAGFHAADLERNRLGQLAPGQPSFIWGASPLFAGAIAAITVIGSLAGGAYELLRGQGLVAFLLGLLAIVVLFLGALYWMDLRSAVSKADGILTKQIQQSSARYSTITQYLLILRTSSSTASQRLQFYVPSSVFDPVPQGGQYRVYYTPRFKLLVNLERLPGWRAHDAPLEMR